MQLTTGRDDDDVKGRGCGCHTQYSEKRANAEREAEVGRRKGSVLKAENLTESARRSVVSGAVPVWVSPRTLMPDGTVLFHKAQ
jgi:hypothetical protein